MRKNRASPGDHWVESFRESWSYAHKIRLQAEVQMNWEEPGASKERVEAWGQAQF